MDRKIKVMIADDQVILAEGIRSVLETDPELEVVGVAFDGFDALKKMEDNLPDVVLMDIRMPNMNGVVATQSIKSKYPDVKVVILTTFDDSDYILNAINNGASGYPFSTTALSCILSLRCSVCFSLPFLSCPCLSLLLSSILPPSFLLSILRVVLSRNLTAYFIILLKRCILSHNLSA